MVLAIEQSLEETRTWPTKQVEDLARRLFDDDQDSDVDAETAWKAEINRRVEQIQSGKVEGIPGEEVSARIRKIVGR